MKKYLAVSFFLLCITALSFAQIYKGEGETRNGTVSFFLHYIEYTGYRYLFYIDEVSIFLDEDNMVKLIAVLEKFVEWEEMAAAGQISLTKTIDSITFTSFHFSRTFFREPLVFYFVFTSASAEPEGRRINDAQSPEDPAESAAPAIRYTLFVDTTLDKITPFRLSSKTIQEMLLALSPEKLNEAWESYENQRALEELFQ